MTRYFIHMAYDGTSYHGWQVQPNGTTVQQVLENALSTLLQTGISVTGAGRTDTGVHASCFYAHFDLPEKLPPGPSRIRHTATDTNSPHHPDFVFRLNRFLPPDIVVYRIWETDSKFHARFSALYREYEYRISRIKPLFDRNYSLYHYGSLDLDEIGKCCRIILETRDFTSFSKLHTDVKTNICTVSHVEWRAHDDGYLFLIRADRFLRNMVRSLTGTMMEVGKGKLTSREFQGIVDAKDRKMAGQSVPAHGLFLTGIGYPGEVEPGQ